VGRESGADKPPGESRVTRSKATRESIGDFIQLFGVSADRPVIDKTGITGCIDQEILVDRAEKPSGD